MKRFPAYALLTLLFWPLAAKLAAKEKLTEGERIELIRGLAAEYAKVKEFLPKSKKPLEFEADGTWDKSHWASVGQEMGPVARVGELVQITRVILLKDRIVLEINGGQKNGRHWYDHVEVGMGNRTTPINQQQNQGNVGTSVEVLFHKPLESVDSAQIKAILKPVLDFDKSTATKLYSETLTPEVKKAITEKRAEEGMDRQQVLLALGRPERKIREVKNGDELEDWIYGTPPGRILFVTFNGDKVLKVKETYAGLGAEAAKPLEVPR
jgi:hypothetical protein